MHNQDVFLEGAVLEEERITSAQLELARRHAREHEVDLEDALLATSAVDCTELAMIKADICEVPFVELSEYKVCFANTQIVPRSLADRFCLFPLFLLDDVLTLAADDPLNLEAMDQIRQVTRCEVDAVLCDRTQLRKLISRAYSLAHDETRQNVDDSGQEISATGEDGIQPIVAAVNQLLADAAALEASDAHINPDETELHVRYRIDGVLREQHAPPLSMHPGIVQRLKVMANLDLTQTRRPQDGKFRYTHDGTLIEVRMSTVPTVCGENVVLRLLASSKRIHDFAELGIPQGMIVEIEELIARPYGMLLVTGPTGSGKTTTLYSMLGRINDPARNILTIEDPVEIRLPYVRQIQVHTQIGLTFATALRSILRQDPDVVLVGEIRDDETATIALQSALTGHMVLSTMHTNDAAGAIARLRDFGLPPFVINSALMGVMAQRLVRKVCQTCIIPDPVEERVRKTFELDDKVEGFVRGKGCNRCGNTGYRGRVGLFELLQLSPGLQSVIEADGSTKQICEHAVSEGFRLLWQDGLEKARLGQTALEEVLKVAAIAATADPYNPSMRMSA